jgi:hypothetical protein
MRGNIHKRKEREGGVCAHLFERSSKKIAIVILGHTVDESSRSRSRTVGSAAIRSPARPTLNVLRSRCASELMQLSDGVGLDCSPLVRIMSIPVEAIHAVNVNRVRSDRFNGHDWVGGRESVTKLKDEW